jgi:hypothetical protein
VCSSVGAPESPHAAAGHATAAHAPRRAAPHQEAIEAEVQRCLREAGPRGHILNVGHGVVQGTPEHNVGFFCELARQSGAFHKQQQQQQQQHNGQQQQQQQPASAAAQQLVGTAT